VLLGNPHLHEKPLGWYEASYDRAVVIWVKKPLLWFVLRRDNKRWFSRPDDWDDRFGNEQYVSVLARKAGVVAPDREFLPKFGIAKYWFRDPSFWKKEIGFALGNAVISSSGGKHVVPRV